MKNKNTNNQHVNADIPINDDQGTSTVEKSSSDNMTDTANAQSDTLSDKKKDTDTDESAAEKSTENDAEIWRDKYIRLQAEFDNFRKRTLREKMDLIESGGNDVLKAILPILDDMIRAVEASEKSDDIKALREGEKLVMQKFVDTLRLKKVVEIETIGADFDPDLHEAVAKFAAGDEKKGKIIDVVQRGYKLGDKVLRFAKVVVGE